MVVPRGNSQAPSLGEAVWESAGASTPPSEQRDLKGEGDSAHALLSRCVGDGERTGM